MTPRYFYRDPLEAAYMMKHSEVKIIVGLPDYPCEYDSYELLIARYAETREVSYASRREEIFINFWGNIRCYLHPDSESILEPQLKDRIEDEKGNNYLVVPDDINRYGQEIAISFAIELFEKGKLKIEKRNGRVFFMPEKEEIL